MDGTGELFHDLVSALPNGFNITIVGYPCDRFLADAESLQAAREAFPATERFVILAESYSTPLAVRLGASTPFNLAGLILCSGFVNSPISGWRRSLLSVAAPFAFRMPLPRSVARRWLVGGDAPETLVDAVCSAVAKVRSEVMTARLREIFHCDVRREFAQVAVPIVYLQASRDRLVDPSALDEMRLIKPDLNFVRIDGPHLILQRQAQKGAQVIADFVRALS